MLLLVAVRAARGHDGHNGRSWPSARIVFTNVEPREALRPLAPSAAEADATGARKRADLFRSDET